MPTKRPTSAARKTAAPRTNPRDLTGRDLEPLRRNQDKTREDLETQIARASDQERKFQAQLDQLNDRVARLEQANVRTKEPPPVPTEPGFTPRR